MPSPKGLPGFVDNAAGWIITRTSHSASFENAASAIWSDRASFVSAAAPSRSPPFKLITHRHQQFSFIFESHFFCWNGIGRRGTLLNSSTQEILLMQHHSQSPAEVSRFTARSLNGEISSLFRVGRRWTKLALHATAAIRYFIKKYNRTQYEKWSKSHKVNHLTFSVSLLAFQLPITFFWNTHTHTHTHTHTKRFNDRNKKILK